VRPTPAERTQLQSEVSGMTRPSVKFTLVTAGLLGVALVLRQAASAARSPGLRSRCCALNCERYPG
jgi:hypothetical protein